MKMQRVERLILGWWGAGLGRVPLAKSGLAESPHCLAAGGSGGHSALQIFTGSQGKTPSSLWWPWGATELSCLVWGIRGQQLLSDRNRMCFCSLFTGVSQ